MPTSTVHLREEGVARCGHTGDTVRAVNRQSAARGLAARAGEAASCRLTGGFRPDGTRT